MSDILERDGWTVPLAGCLILGATLPFILGAVLQAYWTHYELPIADSAYSVRRYLVHPLGMLCFGGTTYGMLKRAYVRGTEGWAILWQCAGALAALFAAAVALEVWRTAPNPGARLLEIAARLAP